MTSISGVAFDEAWLERLTMEIDDLSITVIWIHHRYANKMASGHAKDQLDAKILAERLG